MADMRVALTLTADGSALVGEIRLARAELAQLHSAANDAGAGLRGVAGDGTVTGITQARRAVTGLTGDMAAATTQAAGTQAAARGLSADTARVGTAAASASASVAGASARLRTLGVAANDAGGGLDAAAAAAGRHGTALGGAGEAGAGLLGSVTGLTGGLGALAGAFSIGAIGGFVKGMLDVQIQAEATERRLTALTGGGAALADTQRWLSVTAGRLGADLKGLTESYAGLLPLQKAGLLSTQQARDLTEGLRAAQLRYGASAESMANVSYGLGQALASPVLHLEELAQVTEPLPGLLLDLDKAAGLPAGGFRKLADQGKVTASMFRDTMLKALKGYAADAAAAARGTEAELNRLSNAWERLKKSAARPVASATTAVGGVVTDVLNRVADNWEAGERKILENRLTQLQAELSAALDKRAELEADLERYRSGAGGVFAKRNAANTEKQIVTVNSDIDVILDRLGQLAKQLPIVEDGWAEMWGVAEAGGRSSADELRGPLEAAAEAAGLVVTKNGLLTQSEQELATHTGTLTKVLALAPAELKRLGLSASDVAVIMARLQEKLDPVAAAVAKMNTAAATLAVAPKYRSLYETLDGAEKERGRPLTDNEAADLTKAWATKRKADSAEQVRLTREAADAAVRLGQAQASGNPAAVAQAKAQADVTKALRDGTITQTDRATYYQNRLAEEMAAVNGQAGAAATGLSVQARQARELAAATREGGAAAWEAATRHKVENETRQAGASASSELAARVRDEAEAQRELAQAQWDREVDVQVTQAQALAAAEAQGAEAVAAATIATQAAAQIEKEGVAADSARAKAIGEKTRALAEWQQRQSAAAAGRRADDDLALLREEIRLQGAGAAERERTLTLLREEQATRRDFPLLSAAEREELLKKKALLYDTGASLKAQQALYEEIGNGLGQAFDRIGGSITEAFAKGETAALDFAAIGRASLSELLQLALRLAVINPMKNWVTGGSAPSLWSALSPSGTGSASAQGDVTGALTNAGLSKAGGWALDKAVPGGLSGTLDMWGYSALGLGTPLYGSAGLTTAGGGLASSVGVSAVPGGVTNVAATPSLTGVSAGTGLSAYLGAAGAGAFGGGLLGGWAGTAAGSKAVGAGVGAAAGAGTAALASYLGLSAAGGPVGLAIGAVAGAIMGAIGTQKKGAGPGASVDTELAPDGSGYDRETRTRKGGDAAAATQVSDAVVKTLQALAAAGGTVGGGSRLHIGYNERDGWDTILHGETISTSSDPNDVIRATVNKLRGGGALTFDTALAGRALDKSLSLGSDAETLVGDVGFAKNIAAGVSALKDFDQSVNAVEKSARTAAAEGLAPLSEEFARAQKLGVDGEWKDLVTGQAKVKLGQVINPVDISDTERAVASLRGEMAAWRQASDDLGLGLRDLIDRAETAALDRVRDQRSTALTRATREAGGKGYLNTATDIADEWRAVTRELTALGMDTAQATDLADAKLRALVDGLTTAQADEVAGSLSGSLGDLARELAGAKAATDAATAAQEAATAAAQATADLDSRWREATADTTAGGRIAVLVAQSQADAAINAAKANDILRAGVDALVDDLPDTELRALAARFAGTATVSDSLSAALARVAQSAATAAQEAAAQARAAQDSAATAALLSRTADARRAYTDALSREAGTLRDTAARLREVGAALADLPTSMALDKDLTTLSGASRYALARERLDTLAAKARTGDADAAAQVQAFIPEFLRIARDFQAGAAYNTDARWADDLARELSGLATATATARESEAAALDRQAAALGGTTSAVLSLVEALANYQRALDQRFDTRGDEMTADFRVLAAASAQSGNPYLGNFEGGSWRDWTNQVTAGRNQHFSNDATLAALQRSLVAATGYRDDFGAGGWAAYVHSDQITEVQREAARILYRLSGMVPSFAAGGDHIGGLRLVGENGPELEVTGPARIHSATDTARILRAANSGGGGGADLTPLVTAIGAMGATVQAAVLSSGADTVLAVGELARQVADLSRVVADQGREIRDLSAAVRRGLAA